MPPLFLDANGAEEKWVGVDTAGVLVFCAVIKTQDSNREKLGPGMSLAPSNNRPHGLHKACACGCGYGRIRKTLLMDGQRTKQADGLLCGEAQLREKPCPLCREFQILGNYYGNIQGK